MALTMEQFKKEIRGGKVSKHKKIAELTDAVNNLLATKEGCSPLLKEALEAVIQIAPKENVFNGANSWEITSEGFPQ